ncbi:hypothetical protein KCP78_23395 [Salmonella enterica subsp. enterica]|nr:hypothetical protein KCP78_23395 [Salmonella enterica subsp. enterica]
MKYAAATAWAKSPAGNRYRVAARSAGRHAVGIAAYQNRWRIPTRRWLSRPTRTLPAKRARDEMQGMIHDTQCHVLALYELVRSGKRRRRTKKNGDEINSSTPDFYRRR